MSELIIRRLQPAEYGAARALILASLMEHWGGLDPTLNPDLDDMAGYYRSSVFLGAFRESVLLGVGALIPEGTDAGRIVRMSVAQENRRQGVGQRILLGLLEEARKAGYRRVVLETTATWAGARRLYSRNGFRLLEVRDGDAHYEIIL
jgi:GNAT superfamily N-acetyltransferase